MLSLCICFCAPVCGASFGFDQAYYATGVMAVAFDAPGKQYGASFILPPEMNGKTLSSAKFSVLSVKGTPLPLRVELHQDDNGLPSNTVVAQGSFVPVPNSNTATLSPAMPLQSGVKYHLVVRPNAGNGDEDNYALVSYQTGRLRTDMSLEIDLGQGWLTHPNADPSVILQFSDGTEFGQPYSGYLRGPFFVYGSGATCRFGERFILPSAMNVRKVSFMVLKYGAPTANLRVVIAEDKPGGAQLANEVFCTPGECSSWRYMLQSHVLSSPVALSANTAYKIYVTQEGVADDPKNCYLVVFRTTDNVNLGFGGANCWAFLETSSGYNLKLADRDVHFRLETESVELTRLTPQLLTSNSVTLVLESNQATNATLEYGPTTSYGSSVVSNNASWHNFQLAGLTQGTTYHYRVTLTKPGVPSDTITTEDCSFRTSPTNGTISVAVIGDTQSMDYGATVRLASTRQHDMLLMPGDLIGPQDNLPNAPSSYGVARQEYKWLMQCLLPVTKNSSLYTVLGNHDEPWVPQALSAYQDTMVMPTNGTGDERNYSFDYGPVHFVVLDDVVGVSPSQLAWLDSDLKSTSQRWKVVSCHVLVYGAEPGWCVSNAQAVHAVLNANGVNLVIQGHRHVYNRFYKDNVCYVTNGVATLGGNGATPDGFEYGYSDMPSLQNAGGGPGTIANYINVPGYTHLEVSPTAIHGSFIDPMGRTLDSFTLPNGMLISFAPDGGTFANPTSTVVTCDTPNAVIHYTTNGKEPTEQDQVVASGSSVALNATTTLKAKAFKTGLIPSDTKSSAFILKVATPVFSPVGGTYSSPLQVTISSSTQAATIHYTTNGVDPKQSDPTPSGPISVSTDVTLKAKAWASGMKSSAVATAVYTVVPLHVKKDCLGPTFDGLSWATAFRTIGEALYAGRSGCEIWVAGSFADLNVSTYGERIVLSEGVRVYGGFGGSETSRSQRDTSLRITIIDGGQSGSVVTAPAGLTAATILDGFTIRNGSGTLQSSLRYGGGVYCLGSPTISGNKITGNVADYGGGVYCASGASPTLVNNTLTSNVGSAQGGGICSVASSPTLVNNTICGNYSPSGTGGIWLAGGAPRVVNNAVAFNSSGIAKDAACAPTARRNCVFGNAGYNYSGLAAGVGDVSADPKFVDATNGNYHVAVSSPCVDAAETDSLASVDLDMLSRPVDGNGDGTALPDIGAYETRLYIAGPGGAKKLMDYSAVRMTSVVVTAIFGDRYYVEDPLLSGGIGVLGTISSTGRLVTVDGIMTTLDGERLITASAPSGSALTNVPPPLALSLRMLGGGPSGRQDGVVGWQTQDRNLEPAGGLSNIGMLVKALGKVTISGPGFLYIDDGSGFDDGNPTLKGVRVDWPFVAQPPAVNSFVEITAISSCTQVELHGVGYVVRLLRPISANAVRVIRAAP